MLITNVRLSDEQRFRCTATNSFVNSKSQFITLTTEVGEEDDDDGGGNDLLFPTVQSANVNVRQGDELRLLCTISQRGADQTMEWSFTPRNSSIPISLNDMLGGIQLRYRNVTRHQHEGVYNCSTRGHSQVSNKLPSYVLTDLV